MAFMDLFRPKWKHSDSRIRMIGVGQVEDTQTLARIMQNDPSLEVRCAANKRYFDARSKEIQQTSDQAILVATVRNKDELIGIILAALSKITDRDILQEIASDRSRSLDIRTAAYTAMGDVQRACALAALEAPSSTARRDAVQELNDQVILAKVARSDSDAAVRTCAAERLSDPSASVELVKTSTDPLVRRVIIKRLTDQSILGHVAKSDSDEENRRVAIGRLTDQGILADLVQSCGDAAIRVAAYNKLERPLQDRIVKPKASFVRRKPHVNVGTIGHASHGKTTLVSAITHVLSKHGLAKYVSCERLARASADSPGRETEGITTGSPCCVEYETEKRHYAHVDCPGRVDSIQNMAAGAAQMDGAILVVSAVEGPQPQTSEHILLARQMGVQFIVVFINKTDLVNDIERQDEVEMSTRDLLKKYDFPGDTTAVVRGSALGAIAAENMDAPDARSILDLMSSVDVCIREPARVVDGAFLMPVAHFSSIDGGKAVAVGRVVRGTIAVGETVEISGLRDTATAVIAGIEVFEKTCGSARAGDLVALLLQGINSEEAITGQVVSKPGSTAPCSMVRAELYLLSGEEGGRSTPFFNGDSLQFHFRTASVAGEVRFAEDMAMPGDYVSVEIQLAQSVVLEQGLRFAVREDAKTVGVGKITAVLDAANRQ